MLNVSFTFFENVKTTVAYQWNLQITPQLTEYSITDHISINTYRIITNLFSSVIQLIQQAGLVIILLAHTLGTCDFFLPRVLSLIERVPFLHLFHLGTGRKARERKFCLFLFFFFHASGTPGKKICRYSVRLSEYFRRTPATLTSALVVSTLETTRGLYTLPSRSRRLSPKTTSATARGAIVA